jgi:hypothetical protein
MHPTSPFVAQAKNVSDTLASDKACCSAAASSETTTILFKLQGCCMWPLARRVYVAVSGKAKPNTVWCTHVYLRAKALIVFCFNDLCTALPKGRMVARQKFGLLLSVDL